MPFSWAPVTVLRRQPEAMDRVALGVELDEDGTLTAPTFGDLVDLVVHAVANEEARERRAQFHLLPHPLARHL